MGHYRYTVEKGLSQTRSKVSRVFSKTSSLVASAVVIAGFAIPMGISHAQGGTGGGGGGGGGSTSVGGGGKNSGGVNDTSTTPTTTTTTTTTPVSGRAACDPVTSFTATADLTGLNSAYVQALCVSGKTSETMLFRNTATGAVEYSITDPASSSASYYSPQFNAAYTAELTVYSLKTTPATVIATRSIALTTPTLPENCATITKNSPTVGYWGVYDAIWASYSVNDCGYGRQYVEMRITNLDSGQVEADYSRLPMASMIDFEGPIVKYNTNYQIEIIAHGAMDEVLDSSSVQVLSTPLQ